MLREREIKSFEMWFAMMDLVLCSAALPIWAIAVIAGGSGLLLVLVFCGCGLCVAAQCRGTRAEIKQEEPYSSFSLDRWVCVHALYKSYLCYLNCSYRNTSISPFRDIHGTVKGGFPSRPVSPPRSCIVSSLHTCIYSSCPFWGPLLHVKEHFSLEPLSL